MSSSTGKDILLLFDRPQEPLFIPKGEERVGFDIPTNYLSDKYQPVAGRILNRFGADSQRTVGLKNISIPDLSLPMQLGRNDGFSHLIPSHRRMAGRLVELFLGMRTVEDLMSLAAYCRDRLNLQLFYYALSVAIVHRRDMSDVSLPHHSEIFPDKYMDSSVFHRAREEANVVPAGSRTPIEIPLDYTATDVDPEHRVAYWREDVGVNLNHWHWHLVYPFDGPIVVVNKDRRGELFYYMHHQMQARYNTERLCNGLRRVVPLSDLKATIPEAYFPKLDSMVAGRSWPARPKDFVLSDLDRKVDQLKFSIDDIVRFKDRIVEAIRTRRVLLPNGQFQPLDEERGIDTLGNMIESSILNPNQAYYGDMHNFLHLAISYCHDPDHRFLESFGVMGDNTTAMRDPIFYRVHGFVDDLFNMYKATLQPYSQQQLGFAGIQVTEVRVNSPGSNPNTLSTHWTKSDIDLSRGLDFAPRGSTLVRITHLNHDEFTYSIGVNNNSGRPAIGTVRVFIAPKFNEQGSLLSFNEQRLMMIEMDKFTEFSVNNGRNVITRASTESALTIPFEATFRNLDEGRPDETDLQGSDRFNFCGCGWPQHMLVPKGTQQGYPMELFVMITNFQLDKPSGCRNGVSFCGLRDLKYPDRRAMGFPFDRAGAANVRLLRDFVTPNMKVQQVTVRFSNIVKPRAVSRPANNNNATMVVVVSMNIQ
ncbi:phenoloxidase subunit 1-like [Trichogramma pretiosum]|uniref:phenoloxidase subunit 1-like n=1 Tax=Trichogramma pretiosum TaxID=7493 RepID=UPI000C719C04|nr:phenoloxidase subunit 1-like [Trichogramma pretiosum]